MAYQHLFQNPNFVRSSADLLRRECGGRLRQCLNCRGRHWHLHCKDRNVWPPSRCRLCGEGHYEDECWYYHSLSENDKNSWYEMKWAACDEQRRKLHLERKRLYSLGIPRERLPHYVRDIHHPTDDDNLTDQLC